MDSLDFGVHEAGVTHGASVPMPAANRPLHRLAEVRRLQGITRRTVARRLNVDIATIKLQEQPTTDLPLSTLYAWQRVLESPLAELLVETDEPLSPPVMQRARMVRLMKTAAAILERREPGLSIEVIDLRTLAPYDWEAICRSVEKTSRVLIAHEDSLSWGYGAEIAARIAGELFSMLDAPVGRVGALDTWVGYHPQLENEILPQVETLVAEANRILSY